MEGSETQPTTKSELENLRDLQEDFRLNPSEELKVKIDNKIAEQTSAVPEAAPEVARRALKTESPEFKKWFKDSKVVDSDGKPIVAYHGTNTDKIIAMNTKISRHNIVAGSHWTTDPNVASGYGWSETGQVIPAWLSVQNPANSDDIDNVYTFLRGDDRFKNPTANEVQDELIKRGFDGTKPNKSTWVTFTPEQSKSTFNPGTFDAMNPTLLDI